MSLVGCTGSEESIVDDGGICCGLAQGVVGKEKGGYSVCKNAV